jgi:hypothetical protein
MHIHHINPLLRQLSIYIITMRRLENDVDPGIASCAPPVTSVLQASGRQTTRQVMFVYVYEKKDIRKVKLLQKSEPLASVLKTHMSSYDPTTYVLLHS